MVRTIGEALMKTLKKMAAIAAGHNAVVIRGTNRVHFETRYYPGIISTVRMHRKYFLPF